MTKDATAVIVRCKVCKQKNRAPLRKEAHAKCGKCGHVFARTKLITQMLIDMAPVLGVEVTEA